MRAATASFYAENPEDFLVFQGRTHEKRNTGCSSRMFASPQKPHHNYENLQAFNLFSGTGQNNGKDNFDFDSYVDKILTNAQRIDEEIFQKLQGSFLQIIKTQNGSRVLQKALKKTNKDFLSLILNEIITNIPYLITDPYANYFCQKLFTNLKSVDKIRWITQISPNLVSIAKSKIGTYPIQSLIENLTYFNEKKLMVDLLIGDVLDLCTVSIYYNPIRISRAFM